MTNTKPGKNEDTGSVNRGRHLLKDIYSLWSSHPVTKLKPKERHTHSLEDSNHTGQGNATQYSFSCKPLSSTHNGQTPQSSRDEQTSQ